MLGEMLEDPMQVEEGGSLKGMGLLPVKTIFGSEKRRTRVRGRFQNVEGLLEALEGEEFEGYEIHMGKTERADGYQDISDNSLTTLQDIVSGENGVDGCSCGNVYGTYVHGIFDSENVITSIMQFIARKKGISAEELKGIDLKSFKESQYDLLAKTLREHLDMKKIYEIMGIER